MFAIALSVAACLRAATRVDVAWIVNRPHGEEFDPAEAVGITPGGGRLGSLLSGALDGPLDDVAAVHRNHGRLVQLDIVPTDAAVSGVAAASGISCMVVPGSELPADLWDRLLSREPICLVSELEGDTIVHTSLYTAETISEADDATRRVFERGTSSAEVGHDTVTTALWPRPTLVLVGGGPIAASLEQLATLLGWHAVSAANAHEATGLIATLAPLDSVVVLGHDLELTGRALMAAFAGNVGYIGAVGPSDLHDTRADWLSYQGRTDLTRLSAPAGLDIGARTPHEVALAITSEIVATQAQELSG